MSKQFRTATQTRRGARGGFPEHDDFEGLPVRQWRQEWVNLAPPPPPDTTQQNDRWAIELPFGMPKEYPLLAPHSQELLRAARSGRLYKRPAPTEEEEVDADAPEVKGEKKESESAAEGYMVKMWKQMPRNVEGPSISHLAKRHKNIVTLTARAAAPQITGPTVRRVTVRRTDAAGNPYERTITLAEGQQVDGDIISESYVAAPVATSGELAPQQAAPVRRRPPPPKRKAKGPGRGRKKGKLPLPVPIPRSEPGAEPDGSAVKAKTASADGIKVEEIEDNSTNQDSEMADNSAMPSEDEDGDEGDDGEDEGDGDEGGPDEGDETPEVENSSVQNTSAERDPDQDIEMEDSETSEVIRPSSIEEPDDTRSVAPSSEDDITISKPRFQPPPGLSGLGPLYLSSPRLEGSPLKNVILQSPTDRSPMISPCITSTTTSFSASGYMDTQVQSSMAMDVSVSGGTVTEPFVPETAVETTVKSETDLGEITTTATQVEYAASVEDTVMGGQDDAPETTNNEPLSRLDQLANASGEQQQSETPTITTSEEAPPAIQQPEFPPTPEISEPPPTEQPTAEPTSAEPTPPVQQEDIQPPPQVPQVEETLAPPEKETEALPPPPDSPALLPAATEDEDDGLNLLGSLERELDRQEGMSNASDAVTPVPPAVPAVAEVKKEGGEPAVEGEALKGGGDVVLEEVKETEAAVKAEPTPLAAELKEGE
ncbi:hypothetical protein B0H67DRAFT_638287 [Lasiosphaeris hirsuta]|uniref:Apopolysialoglycoprotein n=1 Tax=Lasiosphaeris hirsuta TaxID=260670 RepID=A0AA40B8P5_9PEZI|nr:hypothetical protein B0H67DRAFT_638287 [Lasiosphaeris hirsuta]